MTRSNFAGGMRMWSVNKTWALELPATLVLVLLGSSATAQGVASESERVRNVENGLLTAVIIRGQPARMKLAERMAHYGVPGVSVAVIDNGRLAWAKGYGVRTAGEAAPVTTETRFQAASISKPVTAMAALALVQQGALSLDEDVNLRLRSWQVPHGDLTIDEKVTLRRLLNHSAGLSRGEVGSYAAGEALPILPQALAGEKPAKLPALTVDTTPGSRWNYSGGGYSVVQQLLIDVTGKGFDELLNEIVFDRLEMSASAFSQPLRSDWEEIAATGHDSTGKPIEGRWRTFPEMAAAGLWTSPSDLARFAIDVQQSFRGESSRVLSADMTKLMVTKHVGDYGLGFWRWYGNRDKFQSWRLQRRIHVHPYRKRKRPGCRGHDERGSW
jgi:CubicO group peptidase (beta-lactamase class C family)